MVEMPPSAGPGPVRSPSRRVIVSIQRLPLSPASEPTAGHAVPEPRSPGPSIDVRLASLAVASGVAGICAASLVGPWVSSSMLRDLGATVPSALVSRAWPGLTALVGLGAAIGAWRTHRRIAGRLTQVSDELRRWLSTAGTGVADRPSDDVDGLARHVHMLHELAESRAADVERLDAALRRTQAEFDARVRERTRELRLEIAERTRAQGQLVAARESAEAASRAKSAFLANMSHELRTPLNAIIGYSQMLMEDAVDTNRTSYDDLHRIEQAGMHLLALINDILDLSKIEAGRLTLQAAPVDAHDLLADVLSTSRPLVERNHNRLVVEGFGTVGRFETDPMRLRQVLLNLLSNAGKFTENGTVTLRAARQTGPGGDQIVFEVTDTGIGMSPDQIDRLFVEFSQADGSTTHRFGGTGLGLAISQRLCHAMDGSIAVTSREGAGTSFTVTVPARLPQQVLALASSTTLDDTSHTSPGATAECG